MDHYPKAPGFKEHDTSLEAAGAIQSRAATLRERAFAYILANPDHTADEVARSLDESVLAIRPRISELHKGGRIVTAGRGRNASGMAAHRWRAITATGSEVAQ